MPPIRFFRVTMLVCQIHLIWPIYVYMALNRVYAIPPLSDYRPVHPDSWSLICRLLTFCLQYSASRDCGAGQICGTGNEKEHSLTLTLQILKLRKRSSENIDQELGCAYLWDIHLFCHHRRGKHVLKHDQV